MTKKQQKDRQDDNQTDRRIHGKVDTVDSPPGRPKEKSSGNNHFIVYPRGGTRTTKDK